MSRSRHGSVCADRGFAWTLLFGAILVGGCASDSGGSGEMSAPEYRGVGYGDPWYWGACCYDDDDVVIGPPPEDRPNVGDRPRPTHPIVRPAPPRPTPMPMPRPAAPRGGGRRR